MTRRVVPGIVLTSAHRHVSEMPYDDERAVLCAVRPTGWLRP